MCSDNIVQETKRAKAEKCINIAAVAGGCISSIPFPIEPTDHILKILITMIIGISRSYGYSLPQNLAYQFVKTSNIRLLVVKNSSQIFGKLIKLIITISPPVDWNPQLSISRALITLTGKYFIQLMEKLESGELQLENSKSESNKEISDEDCNNILLPEWRNILENNKTEFKKELKIELKNNKKRT